MLDVFDQYSAIPEITVIQISPMWLNCSFNHVVINYLECTLSIFQPNSIDYQGNVNMPFNQKDEMLLLFLEISAQPEQDVEL